MKRLEWIGRLAGDMVWGAIFLLNDVAGAIEMKIKSIWMGRK